MRKKIKKELFTILDTIGEAHNEIGVLYKKKDWSSVIDLLTSCQEAAISIGTSIEESEGEGTNTVALLEGYCEFLYEVSVSIQESQDYNIDKALKGLNKKCLLIINSLKNEVPVKLEAVFLPYKASMWDSLESVWMDADADPECDAFVVPIPYFDKRSDGSLGEMHDESGLYPKNVPITSWQEYSIEQRLPDMIFIHNPYDGCNKVTTVHPNFYASNLKKYTNMLVYIPYFICYNDYVMEHFCTLPGTIHANKVVLQSEPVRQTYISEFRTQMKLQKAEHLFPNLEDKFVALGSPKIDKILRTTMDMVEIPPEWQKRIQPEYLEKPKRIILYNTTLQSFINYKEVYLDKLEQVLETLDGREDIIMWWRPHPLMEETIRTMLPAYIARYQAIVTAYKERQCGIFDDTPELNRAIVVSDMYYGDMSSVVELYRATGKPIMIQSLEEVVTE